MLNKLEEQTREVASKRHTTVVGWFGGLTELILMSGKEQKRAN
jgi:hypothetical protein